MQNRGLPSQLGVRPAPELVEHSSSTQSFGWMFAGLLLTAGDRGRRLEPAER